MSLPYCDYCHDGEGGSVFPDYGLAPHVHDLSNDTFIGSTRFLDASEWPENFEPDPETNNRCGTYLYCPHCKAGKDE